MGGFKISDRVKHYLDLNKRGVVVELDYAKPPFDSYRVAWDGSAVPRLFYNRRALILVSPLEQLAECA